MKLYISFMTERERERESARERERERVGHYLMALKSLFHGVLSISETGPAVPKPCLGYKRAGSVTLSPCRVPRPTDTHTGGLKRRGLRL